MNTTKKSFDEILKHVSELIFEAGEYDAAREQLPPLLTTGDGKVWYFYALLPQRGSTTQETELRWLYRMWKAAYLGSKDAKYDLGVDMDAGDMQEQDRKFAAKLFEEAAIAGYAKASYIYGAD